jgi:hypothetical protein
LTDYPRIARKITFVLFLSQCLSPAGFIAASASRATGGNMEVTKTLAEFVVASRFADIPVAVRRESVRSVLNWVGCTVGG